MDKIKLVIITDKGKVTEEFDIRMKIRYLKMKALLKANYVNSNTRALSMADNFYITYQGIRLDDEMALQNASLPNEATLKLNGPFLK